jgi:spore coat protein CotH
MLSEPVDLLGLGSAQRWVLLANASDDSHMRNKLVYDFAQSFGLRYSPEAEWLDLYINGEYVGLYLLCERNEVHDQRVAVGQEDSFLVSMELESRMSKQNIPYVTTESLQSFRIHYPTQDTDTAALRIQQTLQTVENAILSLGSPNDSTAAELENLIDLDSWARKYLIEEVFGNMDASYISQYYYLDDRCRSLNCLQDRCGIMTCLWATVCSGSYPVRRSFWLIVLR